MASVATSKLIEVYIKMRDAKELIEKRHKDELKVLKDQMVKIEVELNRRSLAEDVDSFKTSSGTASVVMTTKVSCSDWGSFCTFLKENNHDPIEFFDKRLNASSVMHYVEEHEGEIPPGVSTFMERKVRIYRPKQKV